MEGAGVWRAGAVSAASILGRGRNLDGDTAEEGGRKAGENYPVCGKLRGSSILRTQTGQRRRWRYRYHGGGIEPVEVRQVWSCLEIRAVIERFNSTHGKLQYDVLQVISVTEATEKSYTSSVHFDTFQGK